MKDKDIPIKYEMKIIDSLKDQGFNDDTLIYLIDRMVMRLHGKLI